MIDTIFNPSGLNVVVDTKPAHLKHLKYAARSKGIKLVTYHSPIEFKKDLHSFEEGTSFFFGQVFYDHDISGTDLARLVKTTLPCRVFLVTVLRRSDFWGEVRAGYIDLVLPKDMYWTEPFDENVISDAEQLQLERALGVPLRYYRNNQELCKDRELWLSRMRQIIPRRISIPVPEPKSVAIKSNVAIRANTQTVATPNNRVVGWFRNMVEFFKWFWFRPNPA